jgi:hypothetical protein
MPGSIVRESCDPYKYVIPETGEEIKLSHTYRYVQTAIPVSVEEDVFA